MTSVLGSFLCTLKFRIKSIKNSHDTVQVILYNTLKVLKEIYKMSSIDSRMEFCSEIDDWWCQLFAMRLGAPLPSERIKLRFIGFVTDRCSEVGCWKIRDDDLTTLFSEFIDNLGEW